ncbi:MAG: hypothetical protein V1721_05105 [Pseudomonadota bacterium]
MPQWFSTGSPFEQWGIVLTILGFAITGYSSFRAMKAAEAAKEAAKEAKEKILFLDVMAESAAALAKIDEIKRLQNDEEWRYLPEKYTELIKKLVVVRKYMEPSLTDVQKKVLVLANAQFTTNQDLVERKIAKKSSLIDVPGLNLVLSEQGTFLHEVFTEIKIGKK